jgi:hypothetical protein
MIMGHSESKYQRLEPKKGKVQKNSSDQLFNVHKQQVQGFLVQSLGAIPPNDKTSSLPNLRRTALKPYSTPNEALASLGNVMRNDGRRHILFTRLSSALDVSLVFLHLKCNEKSCHQYFSSMWLSILTQIRHVSSNQDAAFSSSPDPLAVTYNL